MSSAATRAALVALDAARPAIARLDESRSAEALAADLVEGWTGVERALRILLDASAVSGTELIREARHRQLLGFEQANTLAAFNAVAGHARDASYQPSAADLKVARDALVQFERVLTAPEPASAAAPWAGTLTPPGMRNTPLGGPVVVPPEGRRVFKLRYAVLAVLVIGGVAVGVVSWRGGRRDAAVRRGIDAYGRGMRDSATAAFTQAVQLDPSYALPHIYLARLAREAGNLPEAYAQLQVAIAEDPKSEIGLREMGAYLLVMENYELSRKFYVRALEIDPDDRTAEGFLGCALIKLGRIDEGTRWITRAGTGDWSGCVPAPGSAMRR